MTKSCLGKQAIKRQNVLILIDIFYWFHSVLWHINPCELFNAKSWLYLYIIYVICKGIVCKQYFETNQSSFVSQR